MAAAALTKFDNIYRPRTKPRCASCTTVRGREVFERHRGTTSNAWGWTWLAIECCALVVAVLIRNRLGRHHPGFRALKANLKEIIVIKPPAAGRVPHVP